MVFFLSTILGFSIALAAAICLFRLRRIDKRFLPFVVFVWTGLASELLGYLLIIANRSNVLVYDIYTILEIWIILWMFNRWKHRRVNLRNLLILGSIVTVWWLLENLSVFKISNFNSISIIAFSFLILVLTVQMMNQIIEKGQGPLLRSAQFLICTGFVFYFTNAVLVEMFWLYGLSESDAFATRVYLILIIVNFFTNLIYALAALWIPTRSTFILPS